MREISEVLKMKQKPWMQNDGFHSVLLNSGFQRRIEDPANI